MKLSQREAALRWGIGRTTIYRAIKAGRLSLSDGRRIDVSEMVRVFGEPAAGRSTGPHGASTEGPEVARLQAEVNRLQGVLEAERTHRVSIERNNEDLRQFVRLLEHDRRPWWRFWR
jgi:DNA invertase Pin-like site-specific DNA recombinase